MNSSLFLANIIDFFLYLCLCRQDKESCKTVEDQPPSESGYLQAVDSEGVPLCLSCQQACSTIGGAWDTRFCSHRYRDAKPRRFRGYRHVVYTGASATFEVLVLYYLFCSCHFLLLLRYISGGNTVLFTPLHLF